MSVPNFSEKRINDDIFAETDSVPAANLFPLYHDGRSAIGAGLPTPLSLHLAGSETRAVRACVVTERKPISIMSDRLLKTGCFVSIWIHNPLFSKCATINRFADPIMDPIGQVRYLHLH